LNAEVLSAAAERSSLAPYAEIGRIRMDREAGLVQRTEHDLDVRDHLPVHDQRTAVRASVEPDVRHPHEAKLRRPDGAAGMPRAAELRGRHRRGRGLERRQGGHAGRSVL